MPLRNIYFTVFVILISLFIASKTTPRDQIIRQVAAQLEKRCLEKPDRDELFQGALGGLVAAVGDEPYTAYIPPRDKKEYMREIQGQYAGVGLGNFIKDRESGEFYFVPLRGSPAAKAGLKFGDRIVEIDGKETASLSLVDLTGIFRGKEDTTVTVKIRPRETVKEFAGALAAGAGSVSKNESTDNDGEQTSDSELKEVVITRGVVQQDVVSGDRLDDKENWIFTLKDHPEIGYVCIEEFVDSTGTQTAAALAKLEEQGVKKVILDFRGNPGGFLPDAVAICDELLSDGSPIVETRNKEGVLERYVAHKRRLRRFQVAVIIDGDSASASEIVSAALQDAGVAKVFGTRSFGKGTIQTIYELPCNSGVLRMTTASFWRPSGAPIHRSKDAKPEDSWGVSPDPDCEVQMSPIQRFYCSWVRNVRVLEPDASELNARAFAFMTAQTNGTLERLFKGKGLEKLEAAAELGLDLSKLEEEKSPSAPVEEDEQKNGAEAESNDRRQFTPLGRSPYFDPQLDRAIDYLLSEPEEIKEARSQL